MADPDLQIKEEGIESHASSDLSRQFSFVVT